MPMVLRKGKDYSWYANRVERKKDQNNFQEIADKIQRNYGKRMLSHKYGH